MQINDYSTQALSTDVLGSSDVMDSHDMLEKVLGLVGESGEVAEKFKKIIRDKNAVASIDDKRELAKELGDVLWYINALSNSLGYSLEQVAQMNLEKILSRKSRGKTSGSGDNR